MMTPTVYLVLHPGLRFSLRSKDKRYLAHGTLSPDWYPDVILEQTRALYRKHGLPQPLLVPLQIVLGGLSAPQTA